MDVDEDQREYERRVAESYVIFTLIVLTVIGVGLFMFVLSGMGNSGSGGPRDVPDRASPLIQPWQQAPEQQAATDGGEALP